MARMPAAGSRRRADRDPSPGLPDEPARHRDGRCLVHVPRRSPGAGRRRPHRRARPNESPCSGRTARARQRLILHLNGIHMPARGTVRVAGLPVAKANLGEVRRRVGIVFQDPDDQLFMPTVRQDVAFGPANLGLTRDEIDACVGNALRAVGMESHADRPPHHLSYRRAAPRGTGHRSLHATRRVGARRAIVEPRPRVETRARRDRCGPRHHHRVGHPRPAVRIAAVPAAVLLNRGRVVADDDTGTLLGNENLLAENRLELPFGFDDRLLRST